MKSRRWFSAALFVIAATLSAAQQKSDPASKVLVLKAKWNETYKRVDIDAMK